MAEKGLIRFNTEMLKAVLDNRKTQTRRALKPQPTPQPDRIEWYKEPVNWGWVPTSKSGKIGIFEPFNYLCPYGKSGDKVRIEGIDIIVEYTDIRIEQIQDITEVDVIAEGCPNLAVDEDMTQVLEWFEELFDSIYGTGAFERNLWVWVIEFKEVVNG